MTLVNFDNIDSSSSCLPPNSGTTDSLATNENMRLKIRKWCKNNKFEILDLKVNFLKH